MTAPAPAPTLLRPAPHERPKHWTTRLIRYPLEAALIALLMGIFRLMPMDAASATGGFLMRNIGPRTGLARRARRNLALAMPALHRAEQDRIILEMFDNLGRVAGEYVHLETLWKAATDPQDSRVEIHGAEHVIAMAQDDRPGILFGAHLGNWEIPPGVADAFGLTCGMVYRRPNNPLVSRLLFGLRRKGVGLMIPKGPDGARALLQLLRGGGHLAALVDQKMNDGIAVPFFGRDAMTPPAVPRLAIKMQCPLHPLRVDRLGGARFRITFMPAVEWRETGDTEADVLALATQLNQMIEGWIRERPGQWLWLHNRWPKDARPETGA